MKKMSWMYTLLMLVGCTNDVSFDSTSIMNQSVEFYATFEGEDSRTYIDEQIRMRWTANDYVTIFKKETYNRKYKFKGKTGDNAGSFEQISVDDFYSSFTVPYNFSVYPHSDGNSLDETDLFLTVNMPAEQTYVENSFGLGANTMVAISETGQLIFKNVCSYLRVRLYGEDVSVSSITLTSKGNESISGTAKVTPVMNGYPTCEMIGTGKSIRLICPEPVAVSNDANNPTDFWIVVPPVTLTNGFSVTVENSEGYTQVFEVAKKFIFERNMYTDMNREVTISSEDAIPYLTFTADAEQTLTMSKAVETLEYSVNSGEWKELGTNTVTFGGNHGKLQIRGKSSIGTAHSYYDYSTISFGKNAPVSCSGDIRTLVDYDNYNVVKTEETRFCNLFEGCTALTSAPQLPITTLASHCYRGMFSRCSNLTETPELPATTLTESCYSFMFYKCNNYHFEFSSELPATTLAKSCYEYMFADCTWMTLVPELPATIIAESCYESMFSNCEYIKSSPELPATTLANSCYESMFSGCKSLKSAPQLPATKLAESCYESMFSGCGNLELAPELPAKTLAKSCYKSMFVLSHIKSAPELPAIRLEESCYENMFQNCDGLTTAPELPATTLALSCYASMFSYCDNLTSVPTKLPATTLSENCYSSMFRDCKKLIVAPELPAATLVAHCYYNMFHYCSMLNSVTMLATNISASGCLTNWLWDVASTGTFIKAKEMTSLPSDSNGIPSGWTVVNYYKDDGPLDET